MINKYNWENTFLTFTFCTFIYKVSHEARSRTVENIWEITVSLNILYRENWTRLAAQEISRFQDQLVKRITEDMIASQNANSFAPTQKHDGVTERRVPDYEWNFAKAFLYSLTVLTTIGESTFFFTLLYTLFHCIPLRTETPVVKITQQNFIHQNTKPLKTLLLFTVPVYYI